MAGNLYLYGENTVSEEQLTRIAKKKNMSFQELLDLNPDIKSKDLTQRELVDARFDIGDQEYNLNDMFRLAKKEDQPIEDFLIPSIAAFSSIRLLVVSDLNPLNF